MRARDLSWLLSVCSACGFNLGAGVGSGDGGPGIDAPIVDGPQVADGPPNMPHRKVKLTFQNGTRAVGLADFVVLVVLDATKIDYALTKAGGADLRFTDDNGAQLSYEIDEWAPGGTSYVWVRVPLIDASSDADFIYLHYGDQSLGSAEDPSAVWAGQSSVWHLSQDPGPGGAGDIKDSSAAHNHGTATAAMQTADLTAAMIGKGLHFVGTGLTGITALAMPLGTYTWSMWIKGEAAPIGTTNREPLTNGDVNFNFAWDHSLATYVGGAAQRDTVGWNAVQPTTTWAGMTWYFVTSTYDGTQLCIYRDGNGGSCRTAGSPLPPNGDFEIGLASSSATTFKGWVDEVRVSSTVSDNKRINAEYMNQRANPASPFVLFGATEVDL